MQHQYIYSETLATQIPNPIILLAILCTLGGVAAVLVDASPRSGVAHGASSLRASELVRVRARLTDRRESQVVTTHGILVIWTTKYTVLKKANRMMMVIIEVK